MEPGKFLQEVLSYLSISLLPVNSMFFEKLLLKSLKPMIKNPWSYQNFKKLSHVSLVNKLHNICSRLYALLLDIYKIWRLWTDSYEETNQIWNHTRQYTRPRTVLVLYVGRSANTTATSGDDKAQLATGCKIEESTTKLQKSIESVYGWT